MNVSSRRFARFSPSMARRSRGVITVAALLALALPVAAFAQATALAQTTGAKPAALAPDAARQQRVEALVSQMTLEEKVSQMQNHSAAIPRLGIPAYDWWNEGLHGVARSGYATLFPQAIGLAATWDTDLLHDVANTISIEARAKYNHAIAENNHDIYFGLTVWSPNINIFRDPRWGRGQETYGEDPFLTSRLGVAFVSGLQGDDRQYLRAVSTPKHFAVHSGPESERHRFNVDVSAHDLEDTYLPAFRAAVTEAYAQSVMCAYNAVDGAPACANRHLLVDLLRKDWKFSGFVTSDCAAITDVAEGHRFAPDLEQAAVLSVRAGTDTSCGTEYSVLTKAVKDGSISESELDVSVRRLFLARFRLGMIGAPGDLAYAQIPFTEVDSASHQELALKTARESMVLLKNDGKLLPLNGGYKTIAVIGPNAASLAALEGNYNAVPSHPVTPLEGLRRTFGGKARVLYAQGSAYVDSLPVPVPETVLHPAAGSREDGLRAEYFTSSAATAVATRVDPQIDFDWNGASPLPGVDPSSFHVRWTGVIAVPAPGDYGFSISLAHCYPCDDAESYHVFLDDKEIAQEAWPTAASRSSKGKPFSVHFDSVAPRALRVEYEHSAPRFGAGITLNWQPPAAAMRKEAVQIAQQADVVVAFLGLSPELEGEEMPIKVAGFAGGDRTDLKLPETQEQMLEAVAATGKPIVAVLMNGSALAVNWAQEHAGAILEAWYPGQAGGTAIADTLVGKSNPGGRLPLTFYRSIYQLPAFDDYRMMGRTYRYSKAVPLYAFGSGLSYTQFRYAKPALARDSIAAGDDAKVSVKVTNTGQTDGDEVVEVYLTPPASAISPIRSLIEFRRIHLKAGESRDVSFVLSPRQLSQVDAAGMRAVMAGHYSIHVGGGQPAGDEAGIGLDIAGQMPIPEALQSSKTTGP